MKNFKQIMTIAGATLAMLSTQSLAQNNEAIRFQAEFLADQLTWDDVLTRAGQEGEVQFYYWGGSDNLNVWIDSFVTPELAKQGVKLVANRITSTKDAVDLVIAEKNSGRGIGEGSVDAIWLNGENFFTLSRQKLLFGPFAKNLPNSENFEWNEEDPRSVLNLRDFGVKTNAQEVPWSGEQFVCAVNKAVLSGESIPSTFPELRAFLEENPGTFAYIKPPHYIGNTFVQEVMYAFNPDGTGAEPFQKPIDELGVDELARLTEPGFKFLKDLEPLLLGGPSGATRYLENPASAAGLFRNSEIYMHCEFGLYRVATSRENGTYPQSAEEFIFPVGNMIKNKNYLAIPGNAPNAAAALVFANFMASIDAQISKLETIGYPAGVDIWKLSDADAKRLEDAAPEHFGVSQADLDANIAPDTNATLVDLIEATWLEYIERDSELPILEIMRSAANSNR